MADDRFLDALLDKLQQTPHPHAPRPEFVALAERAPADAAALLRALATVAETVFIDLGWRWISDPGKGQLAGSLELAGIAEGSDGWVDPANGMGLGATAGGEIGIACHWNRGRLELVEIDHEEGTVERFASVGAYFRHVRAQEERKGRAPTQHLRDIFAAAAEPIVDPEPPSLPVPRFEPLRDSELGHPHAAARRHFGHGQGLCESAATPSGRRVLVQRRSFNPPRDNRVVVDEIEGGVRVLDWDPAVEVYGVAAVPGRERILLCTGVPGPLVEIDLDTDARRVLVPAALWSGGFVDDRHLVVATSQGLRVFAYVADGPLGEPVAEVSLAVANACAAAGLVFVRSPDDQGGFAALRWDGESLHRRAFTVVVGDVVVHAWAAVRASADALLTCAVAWDGEARWFRYVPEPVGGA